MGKKVTDIHYIIIFILFSTFLENEIAPGCILQAYKPLNGSSSS